MKELKKTVSFDTCCSRPEAAVSPRFYAPNSSFILTRLRPSFAKKTPLPHRVMSPLHWATTKKVAELLIATGADVNAKNDDGPTPFDCIMGEIEDLLLKHGGKTSEELG